MTTPPPHVIARLMVDNDDLSPVGYDGQGTPIYSWAEDNR